MDELQKFETFRTPRRVYCELFDYAHKFWGNAQTFDPSAGDGRMIAELVRRGNNRRHAIADIRKSEKATWSRNKLLVNTRKCSGNFLEYSMPTVYDAMLTNPPFSLSREFVTHALKFVRNDGVVCILQKLQWLGTQKRSEWLKHYSCLYKVLVIPYRICWEIDTRPDNKADNVEYAWYVFKKGYIGESKIDWLC